MYLTVRLIHSFLPLVVALGVLSPVVAAASESVDFIPEDQINEAGLASPEENETSPYGKKIQSIEFEGLKNVDAALLRTKLSFHPGEIIQAKNFAHKARKSIETLLSLGYFYDVQIVFEIISAQELILRVKVKEDPFVENITFEGNKNLREKEIETATNISKWKTTNRFKEAALAQQLKELYRAKSFQHVQVTPLFTPQDEGHGTLKFIVKEGPKSLVKQILFEGNEHVPSKKLRSLLFTREDWLFGFMNKAGTYYPDALEFDKHLIENYYQSHGYLTAQVANVRVEEDPATKNLTLIFEIKEGDLYTISSVSTNGNDQVSEEALLARIPLRPGCLFSRSAIMESTEILRTIWGEFGYVFAEITPTAFPNQEDKTATVRFTTQLSDPAYVRRVTIKGNEKTREKTIRRQIGFSEGELLTTRKMEEARENIERLGYFDKKEGVNWKLNRFDDKYTDLDLMVKEGKTGSFGVTVNFGAQDVSKESPGPSDSPWHGLSLGANLADMNFWGTGLQYNFNGTYAPKNYSLNASIYNPWVFDRPIGAGATVYHRKTKYEDFRSSRNAPIENTTGGSGTINFVSSTFSYANFIFTGGFDHIRYAPVECNNKQIEKDFTEAMDRRMQGGNLAFFSATVEQDRRNHPLQPSNGYHWTFINKVGITPHSFKERDRDQNFIITTENSICRPFGFYKFEGDFRWYTPLINEYDLIFHFHLHGGIIVPFCGHIVPYRELFHIGGPATVRGFRFGQVGPTLFGDSLGAKKAFFVNIELLFPIRPDNSIRGVLFYDGGAGWDTTDLGFLSNPELVHNNQFNYRHAVGFGLRLTSPTPLRIDWGFKLDPKKRLGESVSEVHFSMSHDF